MNIKQLAKQFRISPMEAEEKYQIALDTAQNIQINPDDDLVMKIFKDLLESKGEKDMKKSNNILLKEGQKILDIKGNLWETEGNETLVSKPKRRVNEMEPIKTIYNIEDYCEEIERISQNVNQYDNYNITLYKVTNSDIREKNSYLEIGDIIEVDDAMNDSSYYLLDKNEKYQALSDPDDFLEEQASNWASNMDDPEIEYFAWGLLDPKDKEVKSNYRGEVKILVEYIYNGYYPLYWVSDEHDNSPIYFDSYAEAEEYIEGLEEGIYYLSHNEAGRPNYYILKA
jgi:hypothetical protein